MAATSKIFLGLIISLLLAASLTAAAKSFTVTETDLVKLSAESIDPDNDKVTYTYSLPLDKNGEWQTGYNDAGEYSINITASDGKSTTTKKIKLTVKNKNRVPILSVQNVTVAEEQTVDLKSFISDPDGDVIKYTFQKPFDEKGIWKPSYKDSGKMVAEFTADDGKDQLKARMELNVLPVNHPPVIKTTFFEGKLLQLKEDGKLEFFVDVQDVDKDKLTYAWNLDGKVVSEERAGKVYLDYNSAGEHQLKLAVNDGKESVTKEWVVTVENKNRNPEIALLPLTVHEGEKVVLPLSKKDLDGDVLTYSFEAPLDERGEWQTGYEDAGDYSLEITAFDGQLFGKTKIKIKVLDTDRAPGIESPNKMYVKEGEKAVWNITSQDPDGDKVKITVEGLPNGAKFDTKKNIIEWKPEYNTIQRSGGKVSNFLNTIRLENYLLYRKAFPITITSCGKETCTTQKSFIIVYNNNRGPALTFLNTTFTIHENEEVKLQPTAVDPDGDVVHYYFTQPFNLRRGTWTPATGEAGEYTIYVTATDGKIGDTEPVTVKVLKDNLAPTISIPNDEITVTEDHLFSFAVSASDPNNDNVTIRLENLPRGASFKDGRLEWQPSFDTVMNKTDTGIRQNLLDRSIYLTKKFSKNRAEVWLRFTASDGQMETVHPVKITVKDVNRIPQMIDSLPESEMVAGINEPIIFHVAVRDLDQDHLTYTWDFDWGQDDVKGSDTIERTFLSPGVKKVKVTVSDGFSSLVKEWKVGVQDIAVEEPAEKEVELEEVPFTIKMYVLKK